MRVLVTYDISTVTEEGEKRLRRVAALMERHGTRVQKSVFECALDNTRVQKLLLLLEQLIVPGEDSVIFYPMGACCAGRVIRVGKSLADPLKPER